MSIQLFADRSFTDAAHRTEDDLYARSKEIEPREQEPERITRSELQPPSYNLSSHMFSSSASLAFV